MQNWLLFWGGENQLSLQQTEFTHLWKSIVFTTNSCLKIRVIKSFREKEGHRTRKTRKILQITPCFSLKTPSNLLLPLKVLGDISYKPLWDTKIVLIESNWERKAARGQGGILQREGGTQTQHQGLGGWSQHVAEAVPLLQRRWRGGHAAGTVTEHVSVKSRTWRGGGHIRGLCRYFGPHGHPTAEVKDPRTIPGGSSVVVPAVLKTEPLISWLDLLVFSFMRHLESEHFRGGKILVNLSV